NLLIGGGYIIYTYVVWRNLGQPMKKNGINESIQINAGELFAGLNFNKKVGRHIWYNEIDLLEDARMHSIYRNPGGVPRSDLPYQNNWNSYLFYRTGLTFSIKRKFILTPFIAFPLLHIIPVDEQRNMLFGELKPFNSIRAGILLTYNFNKK
ncbi:MAG TPA: hypothetical protein VNG53_08720, partial [Bacteroidia bacterium]|nr:hypothetical protein [Bacteroidia bacterium]